jgi:NAD(P)-dependent dehydrogenase (short-subunit alcohol dehydrogenase family)
MSIDEMFSLKGKVAVVIGGGGVLAGEIAQGFAGAGAEVAIVDLNLENATQRALAICKHQRKAIPIQADVTRKADLEAALHTTLENYGRVDILLNGAGINSATPFFEISQEEWDRILSVDLGSVFLASQVFGKAMVDAGRGGSIINISSASSGPPLSKVFTYSVAKGGVNQVTQFLAREFAPYRVRVNALVPGFFPAEQNRKILTPERISQIMSHTPMARFGESSELIGACIYLASEQASSFVTGILLRVDGGYGAMTI